MHKSVNGVGLSGVSLGVAMALRGLFTEQTDNKAVKG